MSLLRDLVKPPLNELANDREIYGDHYDLKINDVRLDLITVCNNINAGTFTIGIPTTGDSIFWDGDKWIPGQGGGAAPTGPAGGDLTGTYPNPTLNKGKAFGQSGLTYTTAPTLNGQVYVYTANNTVNLALCTSVIRCQAVAGIWNSTSSLLNTIRGYQLPIRFKAGLTLAAGDAIYVSDAAGLATNIQPTAMNTYVRPLGFIADASTYNGADGTGSTAVCILDPGPIYYGPNP